MSAQNHRRRAYQQTVKDKIAKRLAELNNLQNTLPVPPKKEETRLFNPTSPTLKKSVIDKIEVTTKAGALNDGKWLAQLKPGMLSLEMCLLCLFKLIVRKNK